MDPPVAAAASKAMSNPDETLDSGDEDCIHPSWYNMMGRLCANCMQCPDGIVSGAHSKFTSCTDQLVHIAFNNNKLSDLVSNCRGDKHTTHPNYRTMWRVPPGTDGPSDDNLFADEVYFILLCAAAMHTVCICGDESIHHFPFSMLFVTAYPTVSATFFCGSETTGQECPAYWNSQRLSLRWRLHATKPSTEPATIIIMWTLTLMLMTSLIPPSLLT